MSRRILTDKNNFSKLFYKRRRNNLSKLFIVIFLLFFLASTTTVVLAAVQIGKYLEELPTEAKIRELLSIRDENSRVYDRNGLLLFTFKNPYQDREYASFSELPPSIILATLAAEDKDFFIHSGIDYVASVSAVVKTIVNSSDGKVGGSTITQQLVKQTLLTSTQTVERKVKEAFLSSVIEQMYTKEEILEFYLNTSSFGGRVVGIKTAAKAYFNKKLQEINLNEAAFLVGLVRAPGEYSPLFAKNPAQALELANERRKFVLEQINSNIRLQNYWETTNIVDLAEVNPSAKVENLTLATLIEKDLTVSPLQDNLLAPHWVFYIRDVLAAAPYNIGVDQLYNGGYEIITSLDYTLQQIAEEEVGNGVNRLGGYYRFENAGLVSIHAETGEILAMVGSKGFNLPKDPNNKRFDPQTNVTTSLQQLGSSLKPWVTYLAFSLGKFKADTVVQDTPKTFAGGYRPKNADGRFYGDLTVRQALLLSRNLPFLKISEAIGVWRLPDLMKKIGYSTDAVYGLAATIGGVDETLVAHTGAYTGLANGGSVLKLKPILIIKNSRGETVFTAETQVQAQLDRGAVATVNNILGDKSYRPGAYSLKFIGASKLAGKSGTSDSNKDNLYMGYGPKLVTGVWVGNNDNTPLRGNAYGLNTALPIWNSFMRRAFSAKPGLNQNGSY